MSGMVALFCGSRGWTDCDAIRLDIERLPDGAVVVEGGALGADRIAREEALKRGLHVATVPALWERYGKSAGPRRNVAMLKLATEVYAYSLGTPGTNHMIALAQRERIPVHVRPGRMRHLERIQRAAWDVVKERVEDKMEAAG